MKRLSESTEAMLKIIQCDLHEKYPEAHSFKIHINKDYIEIEIEVGELNGDLITIQSRAEHSA